MSLLTASVFFLDLQTTGTNPERSHILEVAWGLNENEENESFLVAGVEISPTIQNLTGISSENLKAAISLESIFQKLEALLKKMEDPVAIIHFAQFEIPFLKHAYESQSQTLPFSILCTHQISKRLFPNLPSLGIKAVSGYFGHPVQTLKRGGNHVDATRTIWQNLIPHLSEKGITTIGALKEWLLTAIPKKTKLEYRLPSQKRLQVSKKPGIYRMLNQKKEILYVGKATSLRSRINSYFRGQTNKDPKTKELLTQVWDIEVTECETPLEAALLETDEIKKWDPPYNINLKAGKRGLYFFSRDFLSLSQTQSKSHPLGPFSSAFALDSIRNLSQCLAGKGLKLGTDIFWNEIEENILTEGYLLFCRENNFDPYLFESVRQILAVGLKWGESFKEEKRETEVEIEMTAARVAAKFKRHFIRAGQTYLKSKKIGRLLNCEINLGARVIFVREGKILSSSPFPSLQKSRFPWQGMTINDFDRMSVLYSELIKCKLNPLPQ